MKNNELVVYALVSVVVWLIPVIGFAFRSQCFRGAVKSMLERFKRQSFLVQMFFALLACAAVLRGGSKGPGPIGEVSPLNDAEMSVTADLCDSGSGIVDINCTIAGLSAPTNHMFAVELVDQTSGECLELQNVLLDGMPIDGVTHSVSNGTYHFVWDAEAELGSGIVLDNVIFRVSLVPLQSDGGDSAAEPDETEKYLVIDFSKKTGAADYRVTYLDDVPSGGWSYEDKTMKLVMRKIKKGTFIMGASGYGNAYNFEKPRRVTLTEDFWIGVFEVTQKQWELVTGTKPSEYGGDARPVDSVSYFWIRGNGNEGGWPCFLPIAENSFLGMLRSRVKDFEFDLPSEVQWEYACCAGGAAAFSAEEMNTIARYNANCSDGRGGYYEHTTVGSYEPNAWGLYDMLGNVWEWCLDRYDRSPNAPVPNPEFLTNGDSRIIRGGGWLEGGMPSATFRGINYSTFACYDNGLRLVINTPTSAPSFGYYFSHFADSNPVTIEVRKCFTYQVQDKTGTYCGKNGYSIDLNVDVPNEGCKIEYAESESGPWVETLAYTNACMERTMYFRLTAENYETVVGSANVTVNPKTLTLSSPTKTKTYDGEALTFDASEIVADGYAEGEELDFADIASITEAGETSATFVAVDSETAKVSNYEIIYGYGTLTVEAPSPPPDEPEIPDVPDEPPVEPDQPGKPDEPPVEPDQPGKPDDAGKPGDTGTTDDAGKPGDGTVTPDEPAKETEAVTQEIGDSKSTAITETFTGAGTLTFRWKVSSEAGCDFFAVYVDGGEYAAISGERDWKELSIPIAAGGTHVVKWVYSKDESFSAGEDCGKVKDVKWVPGKPQTGGDGAVSIPSTSDPCFDRAAYAFEMFAGFGIDETYELNNLKGGNVTLKKVGKGKLPAGVKLKWDKKLGRVLLTGAPTKAGTYEYVVGIEEKSGKEKRKGVETKFEFVVKDLAGLPPSDRNYNAAAGKKIKTDIPVWSRSGVYAGVLNVSVTQKGVITAKIKGITKKLINFRGNWQYVADGNMGAVIAAKTGEQLKIVLKKNGNLCASLSKLPGAFGPVVVSSGYGVAASGDYSKYAGGREVVTDDGIRLALKIAKTGKVSYAPADKGDVEHKTVKGTAQLLLNAYEDGSAQVCLVKATKRVSFVYVVRVK